MTVDTGPVARPIATTRSRPASTTRRRSPSSASPSGRTDRSRWGWPLTSAVLRRSADRTLDITEAAGLTLTEQQLTAVATDAFIRWVEQRRAAGDEPGVVIDLDALVRASINEMLQANGFEPLPESAGAASEAPTAEPVESVAPIRRKLIGEGTWHHRRWDTKERTCSITLTVPVELTLEAGGTAGLFIGDTVWDRYDGDALVCFVNGAAQMYPGTWAPVSESDTAATIAYGSAGFDFSVPVTGEMPAASAVTTVVNADKWFETTFTFELHEIE